MYIDSLFSKGIDYLMKQNIQHNGGLIRRKHICM